MPWRFERSRSRPRRRAASSAWTLVLLIGLAVSANAKTRADCAKDYTPQRGQDGKDVIWVPTEDAMVVRMLEMAKVTSADKVYDLGAGDGKIPIAAGKRFGATAVGIEYETELAKLAQCLVEADGLGKRVKVVQGDIFAADFSDATVVTLYLLPALNLRLRPTLLAMKPGTRVVSYSFTMADWSPDDFVDTDDGSAYLWIVPARVDGTWTFQPANGEQPFEITLEQTFQKLKGSVGDAAVSGKLDGARIDFGFTRDDETTHVTGIVSGERIDGTIARDGRVIDYVALRN